MQEIRFHFFLSDTNAIRRDKNLLFVDNKRYIKLLYDIKKWYLNDYYRVL